MYQIFWMTDKLPFYNESTREDLDFLLLLASFDCQINFLLYGKAVLQLLAENPEKIQQRPYFSVLKACPHYPSLHCLVLAESLAQFNIPTKEIPSFFKIINHQAIDKYIKKADYVLGGDVQLC